MKSLLEDASPQSLQDHTFPSQTRTTPRFPAGFDRRSMLLLLRVKQRFSAMNSWSNGWRVFSVLVIRRTGAGVGEQAYGSQRSAQLA
jgi:hypothetical protein